MRLILLAMFLIYVNACSAQREVKSEKPDCVKEKDSTLKRSIYTWVDEMPEYQRGMEDVLKYLTSNFHYPNQDSFQGTIKVEFIVTENGDLKSIKIVNKTSRELTEVDKEVIKVFSKMPRWKPGKCKGTIVPVKILIPIKL